MADESAPKNNKTGLIAGIIAAVAVVIVIICVVLLGSPKVVGKYELSAVIDDGKESTAMVDMIKQMGGEYTAEFKKDKTGVLKMKMGEDDNTIEFEWNDKELKSKNTEDKETIPYEYKDNTVTITLNGEGMKFKRI